MAPVQAWGRLAAVLVLGTSLVACSPMVADHGHRIDEEALAMVRPGETSREQVLRLLGSPSALGTFDADTWYYMSQRKERMSFYQEEVVEQDVVAVRFDERGLVEAVDRRDLAHAQDIQPVAEATPTHGQEITVWQQFLGNIGRFTAPDDRRPGATRSGARLPR